MGTQCQTDDQCAMDEICDNGNCVFSGVSEGGGASPCPEVETLFFGFDSPNLEPADQEKLKGLAECMKTNQTRRSSSKPTPTRAAPRSTTSC
jgi:outer membrane protein OmpA-like peptidoglycan-associated protein